MKFATTFVCLAALAVASCGQGKGGSAPAGQVVATVNGQEITASELRMEMGDAPSDPAKASAAQQNALQSIISRKLLVAAAKERKLDGSPLASMVKQRASEMALVQLLQMSLSSAVPKVSDAEVTEFISAHPASFSQRRLISVEQFVVPQIDPGLIKQMEPLKTMAEIQTLLDSNKVHFLRSGQVLDTVNIDPDAAAKIAGLNVNDVFVSPNGPGAVVSRISGEQVAPLAGDDAQRAAKMLLSQQRNGAQVRASIEQILAAGKSQVKINPAYQGKPAANPAAPSKIDGRPSNPAG